MKRYEAQGELTLPIRMPIIIRLDGNSFSKLTKEHNFKKPFDEDFRCAMEMAMREVFEYSCGLIGYCQSDEITILLYNKEDEFLANRVSKICSLLASKATIGFNKYFLEKNNKYMEACFDCRAFVVPDDEVNNVFLWRQKDAWKNAIYSYAYYELMNKKGYTQKTVTTYLKGKSLEQKQEIIFNELGFNINNLETKYKRGFCITKKDIEVPVSGLSDIAKKYLIGKEFITRSKVVIDLEIPLFSKDKTYIESLLKK
jgi:tRNA(His) 5'-end guanylyltransferase